MDKNYENQLLQHRPEHDAFIELLKAENVRSYLEIGLGWGGSLWRVGCALAPGARIVGLSLAGNPDTRQDILRSIDRLRGEYGQDACLITGNSTDPLTIGAASHFAPFDCIFIDGDHSYAGVKADWTNYSSMGRMIAFHDISWNETWVSKVPGRVTQPMGVPALWDELKPRYRHREIKLYKRKNYYGIGVLWTR